MSRKPRKVSVVVPQISTQEPGQDKREGKDQGRSEETTGGRKPRPSASCLYTSLSLFSISILYLYSLFSISILYSLFSIPYLYSLQALMTTADDDCMAARSLTG